AGALMLMIIGRILCFGLIAVERPGEVRGAIIDDDAADALVADDDVAAGAEHENRDALLVGRAQDLAQLARFRRRHAGVSRATDADGRVARERLVARHRRGRRVLREQRLPDQTSPPDFEVALAFRRSSTMGPMASTSPAPTVKNTSPACNSA